MIVRRTNDLEFTSSGRLHRAGSAFLVGSMVAMVTVGLIYLLVPPKGISGLGWMDVPLRYPGRAPEWFIVSAGDRLTRSVLLLLAAGVVTAGASLATLILMRSRALRREITIRRSVGASSGRLHAGWRREALSTATVATVVAWIVSLTLMIAAGLLDDADIRVRVALVIVSVSPLWAAAVSLGSHRFAGRLVARRDRGTGVLPGADRRIHPPMLRTVAQVGISVAVAGAALVSVKGLDQLQPRPGSMADVTLIPNVDQEILTAALDQRDRRFPTAVSVSAPGGHLGLGASAFLIAQCGDCWEGGMPMPLFPTTATHFYVSPDTFRYLDLEFVRGRAFEMSTREAVVNRALAARYFEGGQAIGRFVEVGPARIWYRVVGVVGGERGPRVVGAGDQPEPAVFLPVVDYPGSVEIAFAGAAGSLSAALTALGSEHGTPRALRDYLAAANAPASRALAILSTLALLVLAISLFGVSVAARLANERRRGELALRRALGARRRDLKMLLSVEAIRTSLVGGMLGIWLGSFLVNLAEEVLGVPGRGSITVLVGVAALHVVCATAAALPAAWDASRRPASADLFLD